MTNSSLKRARSLLGALALAVSLVACGSSADDAASDPEAPTVSIGSGAAAGASPRGPTEPGASTSVAAGSGTATAGAAPPLAPGVDGYDGPAGCVPGAWRVTGGASVAPVARRAGEVYLGACGERAASIDITVDVTGDDAAFGLACAGSSELVVSTRRPTAAEVDACAQTGRSLLTVPLAFESVVLVANPSASAVGCVSFVDLYALFGDRSAGATSWQDAHRVAAELGSVIPAFPDGGLVAVAPEIDGPLAARLQEIVFAELDADLGLRTALRSDLLPVARVSAAVAEVAATPGAVTWVDHANATGSSADVVTMAVARTPGGTCIDPSTATIVDGSYPAARAVFVTTASDGAAVDPAVEAFVDHLLGEGYAPTVAASFGDHGLVGLPSDRLALSRGIWGDR